MQQPDYSISTPENVDLHLEIAGIGNRLLAQLIDTLIQAAIFAFIAILAVAVGMAISVAPLDSKTKGIAYSILAMLAILCMFFMQNLYFIVWEGAWKGQTPGKKLAEIRVIERTGQPIGWGASIIRNLLRVADGVFLLGLVVMLVDKNERRLGDMCAGTIVIRERQAHITDSEIKVQDGLEADSTLDVGRISPADYDLLVDYLKRRGSLTEKARPKVARQIFLHLQEKLADKDSAPESENTEEKGPAAYSDFEKYLEKVYLSYQARAAQ